MWIIGTLARHLVLGVESQLLHRHRQGAALLDDPVRESSGSDDLPAGTRVTSVAAVRKVLAGVHFRREFLKVAVELSLSRGNFARIQIDSGHVLVV
jgi:hypothetical protein